MELNGLDLVFLEVNNLEDSLIFYIRGLGFDLESHSPEAEPPIATLRGGKLKLTLVEQPVTMVRRGRGVHFFIGVTDVDQYYAQLKGRGIDVEPPAEEGWGGRFITLTDPDKYRFFFVTWSERTKGANASLALNYN